MLVGWGAPVFGMIAPRSNPNFSLPVKPLLPVPHQQQPLKHHLPQPGWAQEGQTSYYSHAFMTSSVWQLLHLRSCASISCCLSDVSACLSVRLEQLYFSFSYAFVVDEVMGERNV